MSKYSDKKERMELKESVENVSQIDTDELISKSVHAIKEMNEGIVRSESIVLMKELCKRIVKYYGVSVQWTKQCLDEIEGI